MDDMIKRNKNDCELVFDCVVPYLQDPTVVSLVSKKFYDIDSVTRKHLTVYVHFAPEPSRLTHRFPNLESLTLKSYSHGKWTAGKCSIPVTPWIHEIAKFKCLKSLSIRNMVVTDSDLKRLAKTRGASLRSLEIWGCKMFSVDGLEDIARCCIHLTSLRLQRIDIEDDHVANYKRDGKWFHELALCNSVMESLEFDEPFYGYDTEDVTLLAKKCSNSLVSLNIFPECLRKFREVFKHANKLEHFGYVRLYEDVEDYSGFRFPTNIRGLHLQDVAKDSFPILLPYLNQLRELELHNTGSYCQCYIFKRCPNLEVLTTRDICEDKGLKVIGQFCNRLRKLTHFGWVTQKGLIWLAQGCPNLEYLKVFILDISNKALVSVGTRLKNLRDFRIRLSEKGGKTGFPLDKGVGAMLRGCKKLERLDIHLCPGALTDIGLGYVGTYGHNLRHLSLRYTGESDVGLFELLKGCAKLRKLKLHGCPFNEQAIVSFVFSINQSLRYVWLDHDSCDVSVLTRPMESAQVLTKLYLKLAETLHKIAIQLVADGSDAGSVKITYTSSRVTDDSDTPLIRNMVANSIQNEEWDTLGGASEKPLEIIVRIANVKSRFTSAVSEFGDIKLQGRVKDGVPHLSKVGVFEVDVRLDGHILLSRQVDEPNTIGSVASILGNENVNISSMSVVRAAPRKQAVMVIAVDEKPSEEALKKIAEIAAIKKFVFLEL